VVWRIPFAGPFFRTGPGFLFGGLVVALSADEFLVGVDALVDVLIEIRHAVAHEEGGLAGLAQGAEVVGDEDKGGALADFLEGCLGFFPENHVAYGSELVDEIDVELEGHGQAEAETGAHA
jgi:hypothetical protein